MLSRLPSHPGLILGAGLLVVIVMIACCASWLAPHDPFAQDLVNRLKPPVWSPGGAWRHPFGTDYLGRDELSRVIHGARISLSIGLSVMILSGLIGTLLGMTAGLFGGGVDLVVNYLIATRLALPVVLVALAVVSSVGGSLPTVILVLGLLKWDRFAIVMRAVTRQARAKDYVAAARAAGAGPGHLLLREILPNVMPQLIVIATVEAASAILLEAALSFLGLGVQPPLPSWGLMIAEAKNQMFFSFWPIALPALMLATLVLALNLLGDGLRDVLAGEGGD